MLTYKANNNGTLQAAYCNAVRVGYVEQRSEARWIWSLNVIRKGGGRDFGIAATEAAAKQALADAWAVWLQAAGLKHHAQT